MSGTFSVRIPKAQRDFLDKMAKATDRTRNHIISSALSRMMENYQFVVARVEKGEADRRAGRIVSMADVERRSQTVIDQAKHLP
ncbi:MAG: CopG family ribbon-helix-helix protein [Aestuariivirga sp.]